MRGLLTLTLLLVAQLCGARPVAAEPVRLLLDSAYAPQHVPILLAAMRGHFQKAGIEPVIEPGLGANLVAVMVGQRAFDIGHVTAAAAAAAIGRATPVRMVAIYQPRTTLALVGVKGRVRLGGPRSVEGLRVGMTPGTIDSTLLTLFRRAHNVGVNAMTIVPTDRSAKLTELVGGRLDAVIADALAMRAALRAQGLEAETLAFADQGAPLMGFGFVVHQSMLAGNPELLRKTLSAVRAGFADAAADPAAACGVVRARYALAESTEACAAVLAEFLATTTPAQEPGWGRQSPEAWQTMVEALRAAGEIQGTRPPSAYFSNAVVP